MGKFDGHGMRNGNAPSDRRWTDKLAEHKQFVALVAKCARVLRSMEAADIARIANDPRRDAAHREAARRELHQRRVIAARQAPRPTPARARTASEPSQTDDEIAGWLSMMRHYDERSLHRIATDENEDSACRAAAARELKSRAAVRSVGSAKDPR